jgi:hypothetical protein
MSGLPVNQKFFSEWNPEMSYILGFIVADGCIGTKRVRKDGGRQFFLDITSKDIQLLESIKTAMSASQKIIPKTSKTGYAYRLQIGHQRICEDLIRLGILPRKTYKLGPINVPAEYSPHFVRGFFDGDGSVYLYEVNQTPQIKSSFISANLNFLSDFNSRLCNALGIPLKAIHRVNPGGNRIVCYSICFYIDDSRKLADFMYRGNPILYLERKRQIFEKWKLIKRRHYIKNNYPSKIGWRLNQKLSV